MSSNWARTVLAALSIAVLTCTAGPGAIIVDHDCADLTAIPEGYVSGASSLRVLMRHASVGQGIDWGLDCLAGNHPTNPPCSRFPAGTYDRGHWLWEVRAGNWRAKVDDLVAQTASRAADFDVLMMKFCYIDALGDSRPDWEYYRSRMEQLQADYPDKTFVWWTIPLTRDGQRGTDLFNERVRAFCAANEKILFDIADIECHEGDGTKLTNALGNEVISQNYTKEVHAGHLNPDGRIRVASAFWHLMARIAGWDPQAPAPARHVFVDATHGSDDNDGLTSATPLATIQKGINIATDGDTIVVQPGLYAEDISFGGRNITVTSVEPTRSDIVQRTVIEGVVTFRGTEGPSCALMGFSIDGYVVGFDRLPDADGLNHTHAAISHCILENILTGCGGVIQGCDGTISHCVIANVGYKCRRAWPVSAIVGCHGRIVNCTMVEMRDGIEVLPGGTTTIENCIIHQSAPIHVRPGATANILCSSVESHPQAILGEGKVNWGPGNIDTTPCFAQIGDAQEPGDYHLKSQAGRWDPSEQTWVQDGITSAGIDAGDPNGYWAAELWPHGNRMNMGAFGGTPEASMSLSVFGDAADFDHDGAVGPKDLVALSGEWLTDAALRAEDVDRDGRVNLSDFGRLAETWRVEIESVREPFELVLGPRADWSQEYVGYDPNLPGFHVVGDIASVTLRARMDELPDRLVLAVDTSPSATAMLENFTLVSPYVKLSGEPFNSLVGLTYFRRVHCSQAWEAVPDVETNTYFAFEITGGEVHITFLGPAIELLRAPCQISWIDWYRR